MMFFSAQKGLNKNLVTWKLKKIKEQWRGSEFFHLHFYIIFSGHEKMYLNHKHPKRFNGFLSPGVLALPPSPRRGLPCARWRAWRAPCAGIRDGRRWKTGAGGDRWQVGKFAQRLGEATLHLKLTARKCILKIGRLPKRKPDHIPTIHFQVRTILLVSGRVILCWKLESAWPHEKSGFALGCARFLRSLLLSMKFV